MKLREYRLKIAKFVIVSNILLFVIIIIWSMQPFILEEDIKDIIRLIIPIKILYLTPIIYFIIKNRDENYKKGNPEISKLYFTLSYIIIYSHIFIIFLSFISSILFLCPSIFFLKYEIPIVETFFGSYISLIMSNLFNTKINDILIKSKLK